MPAFEGSTNGKVAKHGTQSGYVIHRTYDIPHEVCQNACKVAHRLWEAGQRKRRAEAWAAEEGGQDG